MPDKRNYIDKTAEEAEEAARVSDIKKLYNYACQPRIYSYFLRPSRGLRVVFT